MSNLTISGNDPVYEYLSEVGITANIAANIVANIDGIESNISGNISSITVISGQYATGTNISTYANIITISGRYAEVFPKSVTYLDVNRAPHTVNGFKDLPPEYFLISGYAASPIRTVTAEYAVYAHIETGYDYLTSNVTTSNVYVGTITQPVLNNYTPGRDALQAAVPKGMV